MSRGVRAVAVAFAVAAAAAGCMGRSESPSVYRGSEKGVSMRLTVPPRSAGPFGAAAEATLTMHITSAGDAVWRRMRRARSLSVFCLWSPKDGGSESQVSDFWHLSGRRLTYVLGSVGDATGAFTCGLHTPSGGSGDPSQRRYIRSALVVARLTRASRAARTVTFRSGGAFPPTTIVGSYSVGGCARDARAVVRDARLFYEHSTAAPGPADLYYYDLRFAYAHFRADGCTSKQLGEEVSRGLTARQRTFLLHNVASDLRRAFRSANPS